jgi:hypothetical protein
VADYLFTRQFSGEPSAFEKSVSARDRNILEEALAAIVQNPNLPGRAELSDPTLPSYLSDREIFLSITVYRVLESLNS